MLIFTVTENEGKTQILEAKNIAEVREKWVEDLMKPLTAGDKVIKPGMSRENASRWFSANCVVRQYASIFEMLLDSGMLPIQHYTQYKLVRQSDPTIAVAIGHQDDSETEVSAGNLLDLCASLEDAADGVSPFVAMEPGGDFYEHQDGPFKFVREVVLVFDLNKEEQGELGKIKADVAAWGDPDNGDDSEED